MSSIVIPAELRPADGRFGSGPAKIRPEQLAALASSGPAYLGTSHRQAPVRSLVHRIRGGLAELFGLPADYTVALGNGGTSAFWEMATFGLIREHSQHLSFGEFSARFAALAGHAPWLSAPTVVESGPGTHPVCWPEPGADAYALTQNETSTGVAMPVRREPDADEGSLVLVDATSAAGGLPVRPAEFDVYYFAPQKGMGSDGGLWIALMSTAAVDRVHEIAAGRRYIPDFLSLRIALENAAKDQTYNTPAVTTLFLLADQIDWMLGRGGLSWTTARTAQSSAILYTWAEKTAYADPFVADPAQRSQVVGTIDIAPELSANDIAASLRANGIVDTESYRKLGRNQLRIGMFPAVDPADVAALTACIDYVAERISGLPHRSKQPSGCPVHPGPGMNSQPRQDPRWGMRNDAHQAELLSEPAHPRTGLAHRSREGSGRPAGSGAVTGEAMRLFVAIAPPSAVLDELDAVVEPLRSSRTDLRWTNREAWHVTLAFLGQVDEPTAAKLAQRLERAARRHHDIQLAFSGAGAFPAAGRANVLWSGLSGDRAALARLAESVVAGATRAGTPPPGKSRRFQPHLTLARCRMPAEVTALVAALDDYRGPTWTADRVHLVRSHLRAAEQPRYSSLASWPLRARDDGQDPA